LRVIEIEIESRRVMKGSQRVLRRRGKKKGSKQERLYVHVQVVEIRERGGEEGGTEPQSEAQIPMVTLSTTVHTF
jgi:hypothetical protein